MAKVLVVVTVYNGERYIAEALQSLREQTYRDLETVVIDDGSTDGTAEAVRPYIGERVRLLSPGRLGRAAALNYGVAAAGGEYIAILDADDLALPTRLERQAELLDHHPEIGLVGAGHRRVYLDGRSVEFPCAEGDVALRRALLFGTAFHHSASMYRRASFERAGRYDDSVPCGVDYDLFLRMAAQCVLGGVPDILCVRRITGDNYFVTTFDARARARARARIRFRHLRGICPAPLWWFYWLAPYAVPGPLRRWLRKRLSGGTRVPRPGP